MKQIETEEEYQAALIRIDELIYAEIGTPEGEEFDELACAIALYEDKNYPMGTASVKYIG